MTLRVLVPCKRLGEGKSRLAPVLSPEERHALCRGFLKATLILARSLAPAANCLLVTGDPEAAALAGSQGMAYLDDAGKGLNPALRMGRDRFCQNAGASLLVLPIDLPRANAETLRALIQRPADVVIAPDRARQGTNVLYLGPKALGLDFLYGLNSFAAHQKAALDAGLTVEVFENESLAFDIDQPEDLTDWRGAAPHPSH